MKSIMLRRKIEKGVVYGWRSLNHKCCIIYCYIDWILVGRKRIIEKINSCVGEVKLRPFNIRGWHNGTSTFIAIDRDQKKYYVKKSTNKKAILSEIESINFLRKSIRTNEDAFDVCDIICSTDTFVVESFLPGNQLSNKTFVDSLDEDEKEMIISKLQLIVEKFHQIGFIHADFTPKNIIINSGNINIIDFEYSIMLDSRKRENSISKNNNKLRDIGSTYAMGIGVVDDAYSLSQIAKYLIPDIISTNYNLWRNINTLIGLHQCDLLHNSL